MSNPFKVKLAWLGVLVGIILAYLLAPSCELGNICVHTELSIWFRYFLGVVLGFLGGLLLSYIFKKLK